MEYIRIIIYMFLSYLTKLQNPKSLKPGIQYGSARNSTPSLQLFIYTRANPFTLGARGPMVRRRTPNPEIAGSSPVERAFLYFGFQRFKDIEIQFPFQAESKIKI